MCEFCELQRQEREKAHRQLRREISLLAKGHLPADTEYPDGCDSIEQREQFRLEILIARAALLHAGTTGGSPTMVLGELAGTMFVAEGEAIIANEILREQRERDAFLN
jgi:hypothetical protein